MKGGIHNPVLLPKAGFFISGNMRIRIWNNTRTWNLKASAFVSLGIHLLLIFAVSILFSNAKVHQSPILFVRVTLHALENEKESLPAFTPPLPTKNQVQKPDSRDPVREPKQKEPVLKNEVMPPIPLPVQTVVKDVPAEEPEQISSPREEEKTANEPSNLIRVAALGTDVYLSREENLSAPAPSALPRRTEENQTSDKPSGNLTGTEQGGSPGEALETGQGRQREGSPRSVREKEQDWDKVVPARTGRGTGPEQEQNLVRDLPGRGFPERVQEYLPNSSPPPEWAEGEGAEERVGLIQDMPKIPSPPILGKRAREGTMGKCC